MLVNCSILANHMDSISHLSDFRMPPGSPFKALSSFFLELGLCFHSNKPCSIKLRLDRWMQAASCFQSAFVGPSDVEIEDSRGSCEGGTGSPDLLL